MKCICGKILTSGFYCSRSCLDAIKEEQARRQNDAVRLYTVEPHDNDNIVRIHHPLEDDYDPPRRLDPG